MKQVVIFSDLDGTLLDAETYSFDKALPALDRIKREGVPLVLCSSKTKAEIRRYRTLIGNGDPFIAENGGGIFIPPGIFGDEFDAAGYEVIETGHELMIRLGAGYDDLRAVIVSLRNDGYDVTGFGDMDAAEVARLTGLTVDDAVLAKDRDFDEPFIIGDGVETEERIVTLIERRGFHVTRGRFLHILGESDKGKAVSILKDLYTRKYRRIVTIALGDRPNDIPMLQQADHPIVVRTPEGVHDPRISLPDLIRAAGIGPEGWNRAVLNVLDSLHAKDGMSD